MNGINQNFDLVVRVLTPVHIGAGQEKAWIKGFNYIYQNNKVFVLDETKIISSINDQEINNWANALSDGKAQEYILRKNSNPETVSQLVFNCFPEPEGEIKTITRTGIGKPILPGSSIKGAIRSAFFGYLYKNSTNVENAVSTRGTDRKGKLIDPNIPVFGPIEANIMRLIRITDAVFDKTELAPTKTYNLSGNIKALKGVWKKGLPSGTNTDMFSNTGFVFTYEILPEGSLSFCRIGLGTQILNVIDENNHSSRPKFIDEVLKKSDPLVHVFKMINLQTKDFIQNEIEFFSTYGGNESDTIISNLEKISEEIPSDNSSCVLHLGAGVSYHGITGDWIHNSHEIDEIKNINGRSRAFFNSKASSKSRKLAFKYDSAGQLVLESMGFIKLYTSESWEIEKSKIEKLLARKEEEKQKILLEQENRRNEEKQAAEEAKKPKIKIFDTLKDGDIVDAKYIGQDGPQAKVKLFTDPEKTASFRYPGGFDTDCILELKISFPNKKNRDQFNLTIHRIKS